MPVDAWDKERDAYANAYARNAGYGGPRADTGFRT